VTEPAAGTRGRAALALLLLVPAPSIGTAMAMVIAPGSAAAKIVFAVLKVWLLAFPLLWLVFVERGRPRLPAPTRRGVLPGLVSGAVIAAIILAAYFTVGHHWIDAPHVHAMAAKNGLASPTLYVVLAAYWCVVNSLLEEYVWRWFVFRRCLDLLTPARTAAAVLLSALLFTLHHIVALTAQFDWRITLLGSLGVFIGGAAWSWLYLRYRSIWPGYLSHVLADAPIFWIGWRIIFHP
jgi:membrane protease YdiL (CAAX protease family)